MKRNRWDILPDYESKGITVHEVKCPICKLHETYLGDEIPNFCYICEERREV